MRADNNLSFVLMIIGVGWIAGCGQQQYPAVKIDKSVSVRGESEDTSAQALTSTRKASDEGAGSSAPVQISVFAKGFEALALQRGGSVRIPIPLADGLSAGSVRAIEFKTSNDELKGSAVQGRALNLVVAEDAHEGRYEGRVFVRLDNGREASQSVKITVIP